MSTDSEAIGKVVSLAGGRLVGKTRLQKSVYILELAGVGFGFPYEYYHYGPYSENVAWAAKDAVLDGAVKEIEEVAQWGGAYSVFTAAQPSYLSATDSVRAELLSKCAKADAVALELAATAALLRSEGVSDCWGETRRRKPMKAIASAVEEAKKLWREIRKVHTPERLPDLG